MVHCRDRFDGSWRWIACHHKTHASTLELYSGSAGEIDFLDSQQRIASGGSANGKFSGELEANLCADEEGINIFV